MIQLNAAEDSTLTFGGEPYALVQFHFHRPSEHLIRGKNFPMEAHFVHAHARARSPWWCVDDGGKA